ncbi:UNVERIFIED_CONTAM: Cyclin-dependent kinase C-1 [Sesamum calycinum]|uniref:Cyclin-dependent kinase C-1 n=1 Tax=Sesamum calycinum TaxID=2727403 RepID=A0AAW2J643_9LAMI
MAREKKVEIVALKKIRMDNEKEGCYMKQLLTGLHYCHVNQVLHRDIKGSNLLIDNEGNLKLADFGLARSFSNDINANLTNRVITLWYRPPELLLGATKYGPAVDMWSVGCIFAELLYGKPILPGKNEPEQLNKIFELCGTPDELSWPGVSKIPWYNKFKPARQMKKRIRELFRHFDRHALDLLEKMLVLDPAQRISAKDALDAEYFWTDPLPCDPKSLPKYESSHEFQTKKKRQQQRQNEELAKRQKLQHPQQHARLPPIQTGQPHPQHWNGPGQQMGNSQPPLPGVPSHHQYGKPRGPPGDPVDTHREGLLVGIIKIVEVKVVVIIAVRFHLRGEDHHFILEIVLLQMLPEELVVHMEHLLIIPKVVNMEFLAAGVQIHKVVTEISSTVGSNSIEWRLRGAKLVQYKKGWEQSTCTGYAAEILGTIKN